MKNTKFIRKLPRYYRYLKEQFEFGKEYISSTELAELMNISPSQIRQDFNKLYYTGYHGIGYNIKGLLQEIERIFDLKTRKNLIIVGAGNLGQTLCNYKEIYNCGFEIKALFDVNPKVVSLVINGIKVYDVDKMEELIKKENITTAILSTPMEVTQKVAKNLYSYGVRTFLNFNPVFFDLPSDVVIENVHIDDNLMMLSYKNKLLAEKKKTN